MIDTPQGATSWTRPNLFGSIGENALFPTNVDFIPSDNKGGVITIRGDEAIWRGLNTEFMQFWAYCYCSPLASVIDRLADADINGEIEFLNKKDDYATGGIVKRLKKLLQKPNPLQTWYEFRAQQVLYKKVFGYCPVYATIPSGFDRTNTIALWNLNPFFCTPVPNPEFDIKKSPNPIKEWNINIFGKQYNIPSEKVFILNDGFLERNRDRVGLPVSKVAGLDWAISNICAAMEADNVLLRKKGPLGFISHDPQRDPVSGYVPMGNMDKKEIQDDLTKYGLTWSQWQYVVTRHGIKWNPMSFNVKDLDTKGTIREGIDMICDRFSYPAELMSGKNATYENRTSAERFLFNTVTIPQNKRDMHTLTVWFDGDDESMSDIKVICSYDDYPVLQDGKVAQGESHKFQTEAYHTQFLDKLITMNQYRTLVDIDTVKGEDFYYGSKEYVKVYGEITPPKNIAA